MSDFLIIASVIIVPFLLGVAVSYSKAYWHGYREGFYDAIKPKGTGDE